MSLLSVVNLGVKVTVPQLTKGAVGLHLVAHPPRPPAAVDYYEEARLKDARLARTRAKTVGSAKAYMRKVAVVNAIGSCKGRNNNEG